MKTLTHLVLAFIIAINLTGCTNMFQPKKETPIIIVDAPPVRFFTAGDFTEGDRQMLQYMLTVAERIPYKDHTYRFPLSAYVDVQESDAESDISSHSKAIIIGEGSKNQPK